MGTGCTGPGDSGRHSADVGQAFSASLLRPLLLPGGQQRLGFGEHEGRGRQGPRLLGLPCLLPTPAPSQLLPCGHWYQRAPLALSFSLTVHRGGPGEVSRPHGGESPLGQCSTGTCLLSFLWVALQRASLSPGTRPRAGETPGPSGCVGEVTKAGVWGSRWPPVPAKPSTLPECRRVWGSGPNQERFPGSRSVPSAQPAFPPAEEPGRLHHPVLHALHPPGRHVLGLLLDQPGSSAGQGVSRYGALTVPRRELAEGREPRSRTQPC